MVLALVGITGDILSLMETDTFELSTDRNTKCTFCVICYLVFDCSVDNLRISRAEMRYEEMLYDQKLVSS